MEVLVERVEQIHQPVEGVGVLALLDKMHKLNFHHLVAMEALV
jgi:hypothetical protein